MHAGPARQIVHSSAAGTLQADLFLPAGKVAFGGAPRPTPSPMPERLSWPAATAAIGLACLSLWVGIGNLVGLILG